MNNLKICEISIELISNKNGLVGFVNFTINNDFKVCNAAIHNCLSHPTGIRLVFPTKEYNGLRLNTIFPINQAAYEVCVVAVANAYRELMERFR